MMRAMVLNTVTVNLMGRILITWKKFTKTTKERERKQNKTQLLTIYNYTKLINCQDTTN